MVIEGLDGSGKTTQALRLRGWLAGRGRRVHARFHPSGDNWAGRRARRFLLAEGRSAHFAASMFYILDVLRSVLLTPWRAHDYVVYVRYLMGTAYLPPPLHLFAHPRYAERQTGGRALSAAHRGQPLPTVRRTRTAGRVWQVPARRRHLRRESRGSTADPHGLRGRHPPSA